jgi:hypothetical protein
MAEQLNTVVQKVESNSGQKEEKYSIEELEVFAENEDTPDAHKRWAKGEIRRLEKQEFEKILDSKLTEKERKIQEEQMKQSSLQNVMARHPEAFKKDNQGRIVGWDNSSPMAQRIAHYMQRPDLKDHPEGLVVASALAYQELGSNYTAKAAKETVKAKAEIKDLQKKTLTEGGGVSSPPPPKTPLSAASEKFAGSGNIKDGTTVFKEILKRRGRIKEG